MVRKSSPTDSATSGITFEVPDEADAEIARVLEGRSPGLDLAMDSDGELSQEDGGSVASSVHRDHDTAEDAVSTVVELAEGDCRVVYKNRGVGELRVCGKPRGQCQRTQPFKHATAPETDRATPGLHFGLPPTRRGGPLDGHLGSTVDALALDRIRAQRDRQQAADAAAFKAGSPGGMVSFSPKVKDGSAGARGWLNKAMEVISPSAGSVSAAASDGPKSQKPAGRKPPPPPVETVESNDEKPPHPKKGPKKMPPPHAAASRLEAALERMEQHRTQFELALSDERKGKKALEKKLARAEGLIGQLLDGTLEVATKGPGKEGGGVPSPSDDSSATSSSEEKKAVKKKKKKKKRAKSSKRSKSKAAWYAVAAGRVPGVYRSWGEAHAQVKGFSGALHQKFGAETEAWEFYLRFRRSASSGSSSSGSSGSSDSDSDSTLPDPVPRGGDRRTSAKGKKPAREVKARYEKHDVDEDVGDSTKLLGVEVDDQYALLDGLSPVGIPTDTKERLADAVLDATALPGTYTPMSGDQELASNIVSALQNTGSMASASQRRMDTGWQNASRNGFSRIKTAEALKVNREKLIDIQERALATMKTNMRGILASELHWKEDDRKQYLQMGAFPFIGRRTLELFIELHTQIQNQLDWSTGQIILSYYQDQLSQIRTASTGSRLLFVVSTYILLRDGAADKFLPTKVLIKMNQLAVTTMLQLKESGSGSRRTENANKRCSHCGGTARFHQGTARSECSFKDLTSGVARKARALAGTKMNEGEPKDAAVAAAIAEASSS